MLYLQRESAHVFNSSFQNIKLLQEGKLIEIDSASYHNTYLENVSAKNVQAESSLGLVSLTSSTPTTLLLKNFSFTNCTLYEQIFILHGTNSKMLSTSIQGL